MAVEMTTSTPVK